MEAEEVRVELGFVMFKETRSCALAFLISDAHSSRSCSESKIQ